MSSEKTILDWAREYCGEKESHESRGAIIVAYMIEVGLKPEHRVLDIGCGALSQGQHLIRYLNDGNYVGMDPNGWLMLAALERDQDLLQKDPKFSHRSDFDAVEYGPFDFVVSHSVMSHMAHWQMPAVLAKVREASRVDTIWISSIRLGKEDMKAEQWQYPGISTFKLQTVAELGRYFGWHVVTSDSLRRRMVENHPSDSLEFLKLTALPTAVEYTNPELRQSWNPDEPWNSVPGCYATNPHEFLQWQREKPWRLARDETRKAWLRAGRIPVEEMTEDERRSEGE